MEEKDKFEELDLVLRQVSSLYRLPLEELQEEARINYEMNGYDIDYVIDFYKGTLWT